MREYMFIFIILCLNPSSFAASSPSLSTQRESTSEEKRPPEPGSGDVDWIQLKNGEWLKGKIVELQDDSLTFKSEKLGTLEIDWDEVYAVYSSRQILLLFSDKTKRQGTLHIEGGHVIVGTAAGEQTYTRDELRSILPGRKTRWDYWSLRWSLGVTVRSGNTDQRDVASFLTLQRRSPLARTRLEVSASHGSAKGKENINNQLASLQQDIFLTRKLYLTPLSLQFYRDKFQNIKYRLTPGVGVGYEFLDRSDVEWDVGLGGGYQFTRYDEVSAGENTSRDGATFLAGTHVKWELTKKIDFELQYDAIIGLREYVNTDHHALTRLSFDLWKDLDFDVSLTWDRIGGPEPRKDGTVPKKDDVRLYVGIGLEF